MKTGNPRRIPPWRRRDAEPSPIVVVVLISISVMVMIAITLLVRQWV